ncbi:MAG: CocE/NonD family hydrolase [Myxococcota bacterium]
MNERLHWGVMIMGLALAGCPSDDAPSVDDAGTGSTGPDMASTTAEADETSSGGENTTPATFEVRPGVEIATVVGAEPGVPLTLYGPEGDALLTMITDEGGLAHFAYIPDEHIVLEAGESTMFPVLEGGTLKAGDGYVIRNDETDPIETTEPFSVLGVDDVPDPALYEDQVLKGIFTSALGIDTGEDPNDGFNYVEVRDGVQLSVMVRFPDRNIYGEGPWPTVVEYSGYSPSRPDRVEPGSMIANLLGYATVGVNMRGTGCSGGVFDVFNPAQHADGYDVVETVARQDWVLGNTVGMVGLSYSGIAQLFVASTRPPSLSAITPLSTIADPWEMQWPGGVYNSGFTRQWIENRNSQAEAGGMNWVTERVDAGDAACEENLVLRSQNIDFESFLHGLEFRPRDADDRSLPLLIQQIDVPVYHTGAFQDEQTGAQFASMFDRYAEREENKFILYNGRHPDGYAPLVLTRWWEFLEFYVAGRVPRMNDLVRAAAGAEFGSAFGAEGLGFEDDRFTEFADDDYEGALAHYLQEPPVRVIFENGAGHEVPGAPLGRFESAYDTWPPAEATPTRWYFDESGLLSSDSPATAGADSYRFDAPAGEETFFGPEGYQLSVPLWDIDWTEFAEGDLLSYVTEPFAADTVIAGPGYADLWMRSEVDDVTVQVTLTEVRPDGIETLVQSGWLRLGHRRFDEAASDELRIVRSYTMEDFESVPTGEYVQARIEIPSTAHAFRAGSSLRVMVSAPGRNHGTWEFEAPDYDSPPTFLVGRGGEQASSIVMPVVTGVDVAPELPACPSLRGQPCRDYRPVGNTAAR